MRRTGGPDGTGASHDEVPSVLRQGRSFWRDQLFRAAGASHGEALALESEGVDAFSYRDLPQMGGDGGILDARRRELPLGVCFPAREAGLPHEDAAAVIGAGFRHAARLRRMEDGESSTPAVGEASAGDASEPRAGRAAAAGFKGDADELVSDIVGGYRLVGIRDPEGNVIGIAS